MKLLLPRFLSRSLAAGLLLLGGQLAAQDTFTPFAGTYQGLLVEETSGDPAGRIDFTVTSKGSLSGALLLKDQKSYKFKSQLSFDEINTTAELTDLDVLKPKEGLELKLSLIIADDGSFSVGGSALLPNFSGDFVQLEDSASRLRFYKAKTDDCPWAGVFSMAFHDAVNNGDETPPGGATIGSATIKPDGVMSVKGTLADGTKFTASARPSEDGSYRFFFGVHKTAGSYFTAFFRLTDRGDDWYHVAADQGFARWAKSPNAKDKSYRDGFDASFDASVVEWKMPGKGETLAGVLGLLENQAFEFALDYDFADDRTPTHLTLDAKNQLVVRKGGAGSPSLLVGTGWGKIFSGKIDPKTGLLTATLNLEDDVDPSPTATKIVKRKVIISGVMTQPALVDSSAFAFGQVLVPPLDPKTGTLVSAATEFVGPFVVDPLVAEAGALAGAYTGTFKVQTSGLTAPSEMPANNSSVAFTVSPDLRSVVFAGRTLRLEEDGDGRPTSMIYSDLKSRPIVVLTLYINTGTGEFFGFSGSYTTPGIPLKVGYFISATDSVSKTE